MPTSFLGLPLWLWIFMVAIIGAVVLMLRNTAARKRHFENEEQMAQRADATHEGAQTRHEGGP